MKLPEPCGKCAPFGGTFMDTPDGMRRCDCARGRALLAASTEATAIREPSPPVISTEFANICTEAMTAMDYFPPEAAARGRIADEIAAICADEEQAIWLAIRMTRLYRKWPGVQELRLVYCARYQALDCLPAIGTSEIYPDGFPSERPPEPELKRLTGKPEPGEISAAESIENTVRDLAELKDMNRATQVKVRDIPVIQLTDENRITQKQMLEAARAYRAARDREQRDLLMVFAVPPATITVERLDAPPGLFKVNYAPVVSVESVSYIDDHGNHQTIIDAEFAEVGEVMPTTTADAIRDYYSNPVDAEDAEVDDRFKRADGGE